MQAELSSLYKVPNHHWWHIQMTLYFVVKNHMKIEDDSWSLQLLSNYN